MSGPILAMVLFHVLQVFLVPALRYGMASEDSVMANALYTLGPRDEGEPTNPLVERAVRAQRNLQETLPAFYAAALLAHVEGAAPLAVTAGWAYVAARLVYLPMYLGGVPGLRTASFAVSLAAVGAIVATLI
jgi:uncharacterized MAPEG superfamily protein